MFGLALRPYIWHILKNDQCMLEKNAYSDTVRWNVLYMSIGFIRSIVLFRSIISLLIFSLVNLSSVESGILKGPIIILLPIFPFSSIYICFKYVFQYWVHIYLQSLKVLNELTPLSLYSVHLLWHRMTKSPL